MKAAAFFDIDGTLYRDSLMVEHFKKLLKYEVLDEALWHNHVKHTYQNWKKRRGNYDDYMMELAEIYMEALKGYDKSKMEFVSDQVITLKGDKVYMYTRDRIEWHKKQGHYVFFISGSPDYLVSRMGEKYGVTESIGTTYLLDENDRYTGEVIQMWDSKSKLNTAKKLVEKYDIDLSESYAYGDTNGDISMFDIVAHPIAINPSKELLTNLKDHPDISKKIEVIVERKDSIYRLDSSVELIHIEDI